MGSRIIDPDCSQSQPPLPMSVTVSGLVEKRGGKEPLAVKVETVRGMLKINVTPKLDRPNQ